MQTIILVCLCIECIVLLCLGLLKKLTKKVFAFICMVTLFCCLAGAALNFSSDSAQKEINEKEYIYMAARLLEDGYPGASLQALSQVPDSGNEEFGIKALRGLDYNQTGLYETAVLYLEEETEEYAVQVRGLAKAKENAEPAFCEEVAQAAIGSLMLEEDKTAKLEAEMKLRFLAEYQTADSGTVEGVQDKDAWIRGRKAVLDGEYERAYEILSEEAKSGDLKDVIIVSNMYVQNYNRRILAENDSEYDRLWQEVTDRQVRVNQLDMEVREEAAEEKTESDTATESERKYEEALAEYNIAWDEISHEAVRRAINYMAANQPENAEENAAYQLQMAYLHYRAGEREEAEGCLQRIFAVEEMNKEQWMGLGLYILRESYLLSMSSGQTDEFDALFGSVLSALYQEIFPDMYFVDFREFCKECLGNIFDGIRIGRINRENYPQITLEVSTLDSELVLADTNMILRDTEAEISDFKVAERELPDMSVCFVLDRSGSMSGQWIVDAKNVIEENVLSMGDNTYLGLVSFENTSRIDCNLTDSKYAVIGTVDNIQASGGTNIAAGLYDGLEVLSAAPGEKVIVLLSDGYDGGYENIDQVLSQLLVNDIVVYAVGLQGCDEDYLSRIASVTGGEYISVSDTAKLTSVYEQIRQTISNIYYVTYTVDSQEEERNVRIRMKDSFIQIKKNYSKTEETLELQENMQEPLDNTEELQRSNYFKQTGSSAGGR